jgi:hypothetical protein
MDTKTDKALRAETTSFDESESVAVTPEAKEALTRFLAHPDMGGMTCSEFLTRAVTTAEAVLEKKASHLKMRRTVVRKLYDREMTDAEVDALLAKLDAVSAPRD